MRGRTNIPPRTGGIVNGVVREYIASGEIKMGDYVQLVANDSSFLLYSRISSLNSSNANIYPVKTIKKPGTKMAFDDTEMYFLSNGKGVLFFYDGKNNQFIILSFSIDNGGIVVKEYYVPFLISETNNNTVADSQFIIKLSENKFLYICYTRSYESGVWYNRGIAELNYDATNDSFSVSSNVSFEYNTEVAYIKPFTAYEVSNNVFLFIGNDYISCGVYNSTQKSFEMKSRIYKSSSDDTFQYVLGFVSGRLIVATYNRNYKVLSVNSSYDILVEKSFNINQYLSHNKFYRVTDNRFVAFNFSGSYVYLNHMQFDITGYIFSVSNSGDVSLVLTSDTITFKIMESAYSSGSMEIKFEYKDGEILLELSKKAASSDDKNNGNSYIKLAKINCSISDNEVEFGDISYIVINNTYPTNSDANRKWNIYPTTINGLVMFSCIPYPNGTNRIYVVNPTFNGFESLFGKSIVKKFETKITGIAKTAALNAETVQVYSPE